MIEYLVAGAIGVIILRIIWQFLVVRKCQCGHALIFHRKDRQIPGYPRDKAKPTWYFCRQCKCYWKQDPKPQKPQPDFLKDCYGLDEHDVGRWNI